MTPTDEDLIAVRNLPPGIVDPSDEALARVRQRVFAQPAPRYQAWKLSLRRFWVPVAAAVAVLLVVGVGLAYLRPRSISQPQPQPLSADPARVRRVFDHLIAAARSAEPLRPRAGQILYQGDRAVDLGLLDGLPYEKTVRTWIEPATATYLGSNEGSSALPAVWESENAKDPYRSAAPGKRPYLKLTSFLDGPTDPAGARRDLIDRITTDSAVSEDDQVWGGIWEMAVLDALFPVERRVALYRVLAGLPVSVGETGVDGRRLVIVRFVSLTGAFVGSVGGGKAYDLLIDPVTGTIAGTQILHDQSAAAWSPPEVAGVDPGPSGRPAPLPLPPGTVDPALIERDLYEFALVEDVGLVP